jgi:hypothetical protein
MKGITNMTPKRSRGLAAAAIVVIVVVCVAACGSSSSSSSSSASAAAASSATSSRAKLAACLKQHGVTLPQRPSGGYGAPPGGGSGAPPAGGAPGQGGFGAGGGRFNNPKFRAAFRACGATAGFRGRRGNLRPSPAAIARFASCVKQHGYTLPKANLSGKGPVYPVKIEHNARFQSASRPCQSVLRPAGGGGAPGGTPPAA